jgi:hypothetical protein
MAEVTYFVALPFVAADDGIAAGEPIECFNPTTVVMRAEVLAGQFPRNSCIQEIQAYKSHQISSMKPLNTLHLRLRVPARTADTFDIASNSELPLAQATPPATNC